MCELFGVSADRKIRVNEYLDAFYKHSVEHHNGWGLALLDDGLVSVEKEPVRAVDSKYLKNRLTGKIETSRCMAHIRKATVGDVSFGNTHPFVLSDFSGKKWVFVHNGTIFESAVLSPYLYVQEGSTDSERVLYYIVEWINRLILTGFDDARKINFINEIVLKLYGTRQNGFAQLHHIPGIYFYQSPDSWRSVGDRWTYEYQFKPMGILKSPEIY